MKIWYKTNFFKRASGNALTAEVEFPGESPWFDGHFPQDPVLPGIAQLGVVHDLLRWAFGKELVIREISRIRFKRKISPSNRVALAVTPGGASQGTYRFKMTCAGEPVCHGMLKVEQKKGERLNGA